jgi:hypothetical protein
MFTLLILTALSACRPLVLTPLAFWPNGYLAQLAAGLCRHFNPWVPSIRILSGKLPSAM